MHELAKICQRCITHSKKISQVHSMHRLLMLRLLDLSIDAQDYQECSQLLPRHCKGLIVLHELHLRNELFYSLLHDILYLAHPCW